MSGTEYQLGVSYAQILENIVGAVPSPTTILALGQPNPPSDSPLNWPFAPNGEIQAQPNTLDVDRYWCAPSERFYASRRLQQDGDLGQ